MISILILGITSILFIYSMSFRSKLVNAIDTVKDSNVRDNSMQTSALFTETSMKEVMNDVRKNINNNMPTVILKDSNYLEAFRDLNRSLNDKKVINSINIDNSLTINRENDSIDSSQYIMGLNSKYRTPVYNLELVERIQPKLNNRREIIDFDNPKLR